MPETAAFQLEVATGKLKDTNHQVSVKSQQNRLNQGVQQCALRYIHLLILFEIRRNSLRSGRSRSLYLFKTSVITTECSNYTAIQYLSPTYKILSNILLSRFTPYAEEITADPQCGFRHNRSTADHIFCIRQILLKKWECDKPVHQIHRGFIKAYDSVTREALYVVRIEFCVPKKQVKPIKMCLNQIYSRVQKGRHLSGMYPFKNGLKHGDASSPLVFNSAV